MRILLLPSSYPPVLGGLQSAVALLAKSLQNAGHTVLVVADRHPRSLPARETRDGLRVERIFFMFPRLCDLRNGRADLFFSSFILAPLTLARLWLLVASFRPEVVNVHFPLFQTPFLLILRRFFRFALVVSTHGTENISDDGTDRVPALRRILRDADAVTACSRSLLLRMTDLEPAIAAKTATIHNGVELDAFADARPHRRPRPYLLAFGRLTQAKGFDLLLRAFQVVAAEFPEVDLIIAGDGEERAALQGLSEDLGLARRAEFIGRASREQVASLLSGCEFVVVPSRWEPFGLVALEAMAGGKCVLGTRGGGLEEFLDREINQLVEPTSEALSAGLRRWLKTPAAMEAGGRKNRDLARRWSPEAMAEGYLQAYRRALDVSP